MAQSFHRAISPSSPSSSLMPRHNKVISQRQYREKEGECFCMLRDVINELTGEEVQTRQDILRKAIDLLLTASEMRKLKDTQAVHATPYETHVLAPEDTTSAHMGYTTEPSHWPQSWQSTPELDAQLRAFYLSQPHDQQHHLMFNADSYNQPGSPGYSEDWSKYFQP